MSAIDPQRNSRNRVRQNKPELETILELEIEAYFRRLAYGQVKSPPFSKASASFVRYSQESHVQKMVRFITDHFQEAITVTDIAAAAGLNAEYAMRLFRKSWGMTPWEFLLQQRIFRAQRLLLGRETKICDIAFACGFGSASRFYHAFRKNCHCAPSAYRQRLAGRD